MKSEGICALCRISGRLVRSHVELPKFVYKRLRHEANTNPNPVLISSDGVRQTQHQQWQHLLCAHCDGDLFGGLGERWVAKSCLQRDGRFPLKDLVLSAPYESNDVDTAVFYTNAVAGIDFAAISYFAASMVWRAQFLENSTVKLGSYDSQFRDYLLQRSTFPEDASLFVAIRHRSNLTQMSHPVVPVEDVHATYYKFQIPGLYFSLIVGRDRPPLVKVGCFVRSAKQPIVDCDSIDLDTDRMLREMALRNRKAGRHWRITDASVKHHLDDV